jgi:F-type H+-transporting ATPase subunit alpha
MGVLEDRVAAPFAAAADAARRRMRTGIELVDAGVVVEVGDGVAEVRDLPGLAADELVAFPDQLMGVAADVEERRAGVILLGPSDALRVGDEVRRTGRVVDAPVGEALLGRVVDALGRPRDGGGPIKTALRKPVERPAPAIIDRAPVDAPLQTGITAVDAVVPIGRGQRELIVGDRQSGKTAVAVAAMLNQRSTGVVCVYCAVGQRASAVAGVIAELRNASMLENTIVVVAGGDEAPGLQFIAPYAAMTMAEYFMERGRDVLIAFDDLTRHARAYRELSLLLRRPPGREAYPGDIFYVHARLLERATHLRAEKGGGSLTALPIIETQAQDISAYIPTNLISITDGQIYLSPTLFDKGVLPAVDIGRSVSRVGGKAQLPAYRAVAGDLRLSYAQFEELESFVRFGTRLDDESRSQLERGRRLREVLKQGEHELISVAGQVAALLAVLDGAFDDLEASEVGHAARLVRRAVHERQPELCERVESGAPLAPDDRARIAEIAQVLVRERSAHGKA